MNKESNTGKDNSDAKKDNAVRRGEESIDARKNIVEKNKPPKKKEKEEQADAEQWHNEG